MSAACPGTPLPGEGRDWLMAALVSQRQDGRLVLSTSWRDGFLDLKSSAFLPTVPPLTIPRCSFSSPPWGCGLHGRLNLLCGCDVAGCRWWRCKHRPRGAGRGSLSPGRLLLFLANALCPIRGSLSAVRPGEGTVDLAHVGAVMNTFAQFPADSP